MELPPIQLDHLKTLTNDTGILQHAKYSIAKRSEGYTTDDNARALIAVLKYYEAYKDRSVTDLIKTYISFLLQMQKPNGKLCNFMDYNLTIHDAELSDSQGRVLWACGYVVNSDLEAGIKHTGKEIFDKGLKWSFSSSSPRIKAYTLMGLHYYKSAFPSDPNVSSNIRALARQLTESYKTHHSPDWYWFEPSLTYANAVLPQALFLAYELTGEKEFLDVAEKSFNFLINVQIMDGIFVPIGNQGWYKKGGNRPLYDQQPIEAAHMIGASSSALHVTGEKKYLHITNLVFNWFFGQNLKGVILYDPVTGGCFDGINPEGLNLNQGAESTICYLLARIEMEKIRRKKDFR